MRIEINLKIILALILFFLLDNIDTYVIFLVFVLIHELAHLFVGILIGGKPRSMNITLFGVSLEFYSYGKKNFIYKILFYIAGPLLNLIIALAFLYTKSDDYYVLKIIYTNLAICAFNLIPILPLDGGKILKEILKKVISPEYGTQFSLMFSKIFLFLITFGYSIMLIKIKNIYFLALLIYLWYLYYIEEKKYNILKRAHDSIKNIVEIKEI